MRKFDVALQGETLLKDVTVDANGSAEQQFVSHTLQRVMIGDTLQITLKPIAGRPVLSGIEIRQAQ